MTKWASQSKIDLKSFMEHSPIFWCLVQFLILIDYVEVPRINVARVLRLSRKFRKHCSVPKCSVWTHTGWKPLAEKSRWSGNNLFSNTKTFKKGLSLHLFSHRIEIIGKNNSCNLVIKSFFEIFCQLSWRPKIIVCGSLN